MDKNYIPIKDLMPHQRIRKISPERGFIEGRIPMGRRAKINMEDEEKTGSSKTEYTYDVYDIFDLEDELVLAALATLATPLSTTDVKSEKVDGSGKKLTAEEFENEAEDKIDEAENARIQDMQREESARYLVEAAEQRTGQKQSFEALVKGCWFWSRRVVDVAEKAGLRHIVNGEEKLAPPSAARRIFFKGVAADFASVFEFGVAEIVENFPLVGVPVPEHLLAANKKASDDSGDSWDLAHMRRLDDLGKMKEAESRKTIGGSG